MMNIGVGSIITKGLGGPACNLMIFGPLHLYIEPYVTPVPSPTIPVPTPTPSGGVGGGGSAGGGIVHDRDDDDDEVQKYKLTFVVNFRKRKVTRSFIVDSFTKDKIIKRVGKINTVKIKFKVVWDKVTNNRFTTRWKK
jgi:hypothetical protein